jgi:hypothetical protein
MAPPRNEPGDIQYPHPYCLHEADFVRLMITVDTMKAQVSTLVQSQTVIERAHILGMGAGTRGQYNDLSRIGAE